MQIRPCHILYLSLKCLEIITLFCKYNYAGFFFGQVSPTHLNSSWRILEFLEFFLEFFWISLEFFEKILEFFGFFLEFWCFGKDFKIVLEFLCSKAEPNKQFVIIQSNSTLEEAEKS